MFFRLPRRMRTGLSTAILLVGAALSPAAIAVSVDDDIPSAKAPVATGERIDPAKSDMPEIIAADDLAAMLDLARGYGEAELTMIENGDPVIVGEISGVAYQLFFLNCADDHTGCAIMNFYAIWDVQDVAISAINEFNRMQPFNKAYLTPGNLPVVEMNLSTVGGLTRGQLDAAFERWTITLAEFPRQVLGVGR